MNNNPNKKQQQVLDELNIKNNYKFFPQNKILVCNFPQKRDQRKFWELPQYYIIDRNGLVMTYEWQIANIDNNYEIRFGTKPFDIIIVIDRNTLIANCYSMKDNYHILDDIMLEEKDLKPYIKKIKNILS